MPFLVVLLGMGLYLVYIVLAVQGRDVDDFEPNIVQRQGPVELPKGYYVLNNKATKLSGVPKYVYLGEENPNN